jgi:hypothetical protein
LIASSGSFLGLKGLERETNRNLGIPAIPGPGGKFPNGVLPGLCPVFVLKTKDKLAGSHIFLIRCFPPFGAGTAAPG